MFKNYMQIAGVIDEEEAGLLIECGVKSIGFPLRLSSHEEDLSEYVAANIIRSLPTSTHGVLITYLSEAVDVSELSKFLGTNIVQVHGDIEESELAKLRRITPNLVIIKSLIVRDDNMLELENTLKIISHYVDAFITDTFDPDAGAFGATGKTHDWGISRRLVEFSSKPIILAGGLNPENVHKAIIKVKPAGVHVHTGVELKNGRKSRVLVQAFVSESKRAFKQIRSI